MQKKVIYLDMEEYCMTEPPHSLLRSLVRQISVVDWYMSWNEYVFHLHKTRYKS